MLYIDNSEEKIKDYINNFALRHYTTPNINGFGFGFKKVNGCDTNIPTLTFFVNKKLSPSQLSPRYIIPKSIASLTTDVIELNEFSYNYAPYSNTEERADKFRPAFSGLSCSNALAPPESEGCITAAVTQVPKNLGVHILSCNHVLTRDFRGKVDDSVVQPAIAYRNYTTIGKVSYVSVLIPRVDLNVAPAKDEFHIVDAATAYVGPNDTENITRRIFLNAGVGEDRTVINGTIPPKAGDEVWKIGPFPTLTTTKGKISYTNVTLAAVKLRDKFFAFKDQNLANIPFNRGDAGALLMKSKALSSRNDAVGMCITAYSNPADNKVYALFTSIDAVLSKMRIALI